jgi:hypothetical protein
MRFVSIAGNDGDRADHFVSHSFLIRDREHGMDVYLGTFPTPKDPSATLEDRGKTLGEAGIRTLGTLLGYNALAKRRIPREQILT